METFDYLLGLTANIFQVVAGLYGCLILWRSYTESKKLNAIEEARAEEYYKSLGEHKDSKRRFEIFTVLAMKMLLRIKDENHVQHIMIRLFFVGTFAFAISIILKLNVDTSTFAYNIGGSVFMIEGIIAYTLAFLLGERIDKRIDKSSLRIAKYLETASKDLIDDEFK